MSVRKLLAMITAVLATAAGVPAHAGSFGEITPNDGSNESAYALLYTWDNRMLVQNWGEQEITVSYSDPTYGDQSVRLAPAEKGRFYTETYLCADPTFYTAADLNLPRVTVAFYADAASPVTVTGLSNMRTDTPDPLEYAQGEVRRAKRHLGRASREVREARVELRQAIESRKQKRIAKAKADLSKAVRVRKKAKSTLAARRERLTVLEAQYAFCASRRVG